MLTCKKINIPLIFYYLFIADGYRYTLWKRKFAFNSGNLATKLLMTGVNIFFQGKEQRVNSLNK